MHALVRELPDQIATRARALPEQIVSLSGAARDLTATTAQVSRREFDRAMRELDRAKDLGKGLSQDFQHRLGQYARRDTRSSRYPLAISAIVLGAVVGGAILASPSVRTFLREGWDALRRRRNGETALAGDGSAQPARRAPRQRQEDLLDEGIEESFPASDPVSVKHIT